MSYRQIAVCVEKEESTVALAVAANRLGAGIHAYVNGVHALPTFEVPNAVSPYITHDMLTKIRNSAVDSAAKMKTEFGKIMSQGDTNWKWIEHSVAHETQFSPYLDCALTSDIVVTAKPAFGIAESDLLRQLLVKIGTPVLVVPGDTELKAFGDRIAVAWNSTAESARAVRDAMPLLASAKEVHLISVGAIDGDAESDSAEETSLMQYLEHHNVRCSLHRLIGKHLNVSLNLLDYARQHDIDMVVMGGFGHSRLYDIVVGAATGEVIKNMDIPVFMSH